LRHDVEEPPNINKCKVELRKAQRLLKSIKKRAHNLSIEFLLHALDEATVESEEAREKAIRNIIRSKENYNHLHAFGKYLRQPTRADFPAY
jgi:hypothetical protein